MLEMKARINGEFKWLEVGKQDTEILKSDCAWGWRSDIKGFEHSFWFGEPFDADFLKTCQDTYLFLKAWDVEDLQGLDDLLEEGYDLYSTIDNYLANKVAKLAF